LNGLVLGLKISRINYLNAVKQIVDWVITSESRMVFAANVHMVMEAHDSKEFAGVVNIADLVTPDGMPLVWMLRLKGFKEQERVYGPTLMLHILETAARNHIPVGFYGGNPEVLDRLVKKMKGKFPELNIVHSYSPPFRTLTYAEDIKVSRDIQEAGVRILFVGLGCPKQEIWMAEHRGRINAVMVGVGAAFDFQAGSKAQAPSWMQAIGLEWLFRFLHEPRRLARRYLYNNPRFVVLALADILGILYGGKKEA